MSLKKDLECLINRTPENFKLNSVLLGDENPNYNTLDSQQYLADCDRLFRLFYNCFMSGELIKGIKQHQLTKELLEATINNFIRENSK